MEDTNQDRSRMMSGSGKILNADDSIYDFTLGFRSLIGTVLGIFTTGVGMLTSLGQILAELGLILTAVSRGVIDSATAAYTGIDYAHHEIHSGNSFECWYEQTVSDIGDRTIIAFKTPDSAKRLHIIPLASASLSAHARILEAPTITDNTGASLDVWNRKRSSTKESIVIDTSQNPDVPGQAMYFTEVTMGNVTGGDEIAHAHLQAGEGRKALGGTARDTQEWELKPDTLYAFEVESLTDEDNACVVELNWYEHTDVA